MIIDQTGTLANVRRHDYLPFGEEVIAGTAGRSPSLGYTAGDGVRQQFTAQERDLETSLDYFVARYSSSMQGRFSSPDHFGGSELNPQSLNLYTYVQNNPLLYVDPTGHIPLDPQLDPYNWSRCETQDPPDYKPEFRPCTVGIDAGCSENSTVLGAVTHSGDFDYTNHDNFC